MAASDQLSTTFSALADPTRRQMLARLTEGQMTVAQLARPFNLSPPGITKHLKVLERAGLIQRTRNAQWRPCNLRAQPLATAADWIDTYRRFWEPTPDQPDNNQPEPPEPQINHTGIDESHW